MFIQSGDRHAFGFEVGSAAALDALDGRLEAAKVLVERLPAADPHLMMGMFSLDDVGQAYDLAAGVKDRIATTLGRHAKDYMTSFYARTPEELMIEYGWGGRSIDPAGWRPVEVTHGPSLWGHDRTWLPPEQLARSRAPRARAAAEGLRQPVQVIEGNYQLGVGTCARWDGVRASARPEAGSSEGA